MLFRKVEMAQLGSFEIKNFQKNLQSKCFCHPKIPRIIFISEKMVGRYTLILINTKDKAPGPAVIETAEEEHKEVSKRTGLVQD